MSPPSEVLPTARLRQDVASPGTEARIVAED
jgi:hypothetical protein